MKNTLLIIAALLVLAACSKKKSAGPVYNFACWADQVSTYMDTSKTVTYRATTKMAILDTMKGVDTAGVVNYLKNYIAGYPKTTITADTAIVVTVYTHYQQIP